jgi:hypothetical protein
VQLDVTIKRTKTRNRLAQGSGREGHIPEL